MGAMSLLDSQTSPNVPSCTDSGVSASTSDICRAFTEHRELTANEDHNAHRSTIKSNMNKYAVNGTDNFE